MSTMRLIVPEGRAPIDVVDPSEEEVVVAIRSLDGSTATELYLQPDSEDPETYFAVTGGADGWYLAFICYGNERFVEATSPDARGSEVDWCVEASRASTRRRS